MTEAEIETAAALLADARRRCVQIDALPVTPSSVAEGHAIQDRVAELLASRSAPSRPARRLMASRRAA